MRISKRSVRALPRSKPSESFGKRTRVRRWGLWVLAAVVVLALIHTFLIQSFTVTTPSMEGTLEAHDLLLVSKLAYGPRLPVTPVAVPFALHSVWGLKSYADRPRFGYHRLKGSPVSRGDVVAFNFPEGDTVIKQQPGENYYALKRAYGIRYLQDHYTLLSRPLDRRDVRVARCVGLPGDTLEITGGVVYDDGVAETPPAALRRQYVVAVTGPFNLARLREMHIDDSFAIVGHRICVFNLSGNDSARLSGFANVTRITRAVVRGADAAVFPHDTARFPWNPDRLGPLVVPRSGMSVPLDTASVVLYRRIITRYEHHRLRVTAGKILIDGRPAKSYTFRMNYYWMMGDNRAVARDSRYWGFVPEDHLIGKAWFIVASYGGGGVRWKRLLHGID